MEPLNYYRIQEIREVFIQVVVLQVHQLVFTILGNFIKSGVLLLKLELESGLE